MSGIDIKTLHAAAKLGVRFYFELSAPGGVQTYFASPEELLILERDPESFEAQAHGLTVEQYREWSGHECSVVCCATTKAGNRCTNFAKGGFQVSAKEWLARYGENCVNHGG